MDGTPKNLSNEQRAEVVKAQRLIIKVLDQIDFEYDEYFPLYTASNSLDRVLN